MNVCTFVMKYVVLKLFQFYKKFTKACKAIFITSLILVFLLIVFFVFRNTVLHYVIDKKVHNFNARYPAELKIGESYFSGLLGITLKDVQIIPKNKDTLLRVNSVSSNLRFFPLITGKIKLGDLELNDTYVHLMKKDSTDNFSFLLKKKKEKKEPIVTSKSYGEQLDALMDGVFDKIPSSITLKNFNVSVQTDSQKVVFNMQDFDIVSHQFKTNINITEDSLHYNWILEGNIHPSDRTAGIKLYSSAGKASVPYIKRRWGMKLQFDTLQLQLANNTLSDDIFTVNGFASVVGLVVNHRRIAETDVSLNNASVDYKVNVGNDYFELDSISIIRYNKLSFNPYVRFRPKPTKQLTLKINKENFSAQDFFESLPKGLFTNLEGIKTEGTFSYHLNFFVDTKEPDSLDFYSDLIPHNFKIISFGATDFRMINGPFTYTAYEQGSPVASFIVGPDNIDFVPLEEIPEVMRECVMISEDLGFYYHRGFYLDAFQMAIAQNIKEKRFVRGASTLTMQLVKNVFLNRNKTMLRKLEEILIVWLIENNGLCSKDRMFEVYLNIIEWGPGIYGIDQAAHFYFNKSPAKLNPSECIFLASIISHPKWFASSFDEKGHLKQDYMVDYYKLMADKLLEQEKISLKEYDKIAPDVELNGRAKLMLKTDTLKVNLDSLMKFDFRNN